jgi:hypothetical protein
MEPITLTIEERNVLLQLLDIAIKHPTDGGLKVSGATEYFKQKLIAASPQPQEPEEEAEADTE